MSRENRLGETIYSTLLNFGRQAQTVRILFAGQSGRTGDSTGKTVIITETMQNLLLLLQLAATLPLVGIIWTIQVVQYPFYAAVGAENFQKYHASHTFWITPVVAPLMLVELAGSVLIVFYPPDAVDGELIWLGLILAIVVWLSTFFLQVPLHERLAHGFDADAHAALVKSNWIRTAAWSLHGALVLYFVWKSLR